MAGLPLVVVLNFYNITPWMLVTIKEINKPQDLHGKKIAVSGIRTTGHQLMTAWFKKYEINEKEVGFIMTGGTAGSFAALASEQVAGAVLTPPFDDKAVIERFQKVHADWRPARHTDLRSDGYPNRSDEPSRPSAKNHRGIV